MAGRFNSLHAKGLTETRANELVSKVVPSTLGTAWPYPHSSPAPDPRELEYDKKLGGLGSLPPSTPPPSYHAPPPTHEGRVEAIDPPGRVEEALDGSGDVSGGYGGVSDDRSGGLPDGARDGFSAMKALMAAVTQEKNACESGARLEVVDGRQGDVAPARSGGTPGLDAHVAVWEAGAMKAPGEGMGGNTAGVDARCRVPWGFSEQRAGGVSEGDALARRRETQKRARDEGRHFPGARWEMGYGAYGYASVPRESVVATRTWLRPPRRKKVRDDVSGVWGL